MTKNDERKKTIGAASLHLVLKQSTRKHRLDDTNRKHLFAFGWWFNKREGSDVNKRKWHTITIVDSHVKSLMGLKLIFHACHSLTGYVCFLFKLPSSRLFVLKINLDCAFCVF